MLYTMLHFVYTWKTDFSKCNPWFYFL